LFPVFAKVREKARQTSCASNLKQIGLGFTQYVQDNDETYPPVNVSGGNQEWGQSIYPYIKSANVFKCPSNPFANTRVLGGANPAPNGAPQLPASYAVNYHVLGWWAAVTSLPPITIAGINTPSGKILVAESQGEHGIAHEDWTGVNDWSNRSFSGHTGLMNCAFLDGHVKTLRPTQTINAPGATPQFNMWGNFQTNVPADGPNCGGKITGPDWNGQPDNNINCEAGPPTGELMAALRNLETKYK